MSLDWVQIEFGTARYDQMIDLRTRVLRTPLGLVFKPEDLARDADDALFGLLDGEAMVGCLILTPVDEDRIKMRQVAIDPARQNGGLGSHMVGESEAWARQNGYTDMVLHARQTAVRFYEKLGYAVVDEPFEEVGIPHRRMVKRLA